MNAADISGMDAGLGRFDAVMGHGRGNSGARAALVAPAGRSPSGEGRRELQRVLAHFHRGSHEDAFMLLREYRDSVHDRPLLAQLLATIGAETAGSILTDWQAHIRAFFADVGMTDAAAAPLPDDIAGPLRRLLVKLSASELLHTTRAMTGPGPNTRRTTRFVQETMPWLRTRSSGTTCRSTSKPSAVSAFAVCSAWGAQSPGGLSEGTRTRSARNASISACQASR